jgi:3-oxoacyl-[acyl-carrier-protein] synthase-3
VVSNEEAGARFGDEAKKIIKSTGIITRRVAEADQGVSDLCLPAAERLLADLKWEKDSVDALILVTQTSDYLCPATACLLQDRIGLRRTCAAFDISLGCSGYPYGLWVAASLIASGAVKRVLFLAGEVTTRRTSPDDRGSALIFGDAGTATALEASPGAGPWHFNLGTDGSGGEHIVVPAGGSRLPSSERTIQKQTPEEGSTRSLGELSMNGVEVFIFSTREVPALVRGLMTEVGKSVDSIDGLVMHQANEFMLKTIAKSLKLPMEKVPLSLREFGNTSSATIPLTMTHALGAQLQERSMNLVLAGFGVGWSWGAVEGSFGPMVISPLVEIPPSVSKPVFTGGLSL